VIRDRKRSEASENGAASAQTLAQVQRALKTLSAGNRTLLRAQEEAQLLRDMCRVIVEEGGYRLAGVAYAEHDADKSIRWVGMAVAEPGLDRVVTDHVSTWADTDAGGTATGTAIRTGQAIVGRHLRTDPHYASWRNDWIGELLKRDCASVSAFPLMVEGEVIGALVMSHSEPDAFDTEEVALLSELAEDLSYGIANLRTRAKHREAQALIERMAYYDALTGLPNRVALRERLEAAIEQARQQHRPLALLHLEVGRYQEISDTLGYREADQLLQAIAARLGRIIRKGETVARVGEADFALLLPNSGADHGIRAARELLAALNEPVELVGLMVTARASIGIALFPGHGADPDALIRRAKVAAYEAKRTAEGYGLYTGSLDAECTRRLTLMGDLTRAIEHNELLLYCQPKVHIPSGEVCGAEALVRWQHPQQGMLATAEFIKLAESSGLITPLTHWVLEAAFRQSYTWGEAGLARPLSVNLSAQDLRDPTLLDRIKGLFATWGTPPDRIQFELTESALMDDPAGALEALKRLKQLGVELFIDDFGTGYSSLSYLQKLPVDSIKIDQSFVANMLASSDSAIIVRSTIDLGHNLDLEVVAEGVENQAVWERLAALGCDTAQGYFVGKPIPADQFKSWEARWRVH
jgi:diguanylate cyclase (GGDEF)-like protein